MLKCSAIHSIPPTLASLGEDINGDFESRPPVNSKQPGPFDNQNKNLWGNTVSKCSNPGFRNTSVVAPTKDLLCIGDLVKERWRVVRKLGGGGFGEIYEAVDVKRMLYGKADTAGSVNAISQPVCAQCTSKAMLKDADPQPIFIPELGYVVNKLNHSGTTSDSGIGLPQVSLEPNAQITTTNSISGISGTIEERLRFPSRCQPVAIDVSTKCEELNGQLDPSSIRTQLSRVIAKNTSCAVCKLPVTSKRTSRPNSVPNENCTSVDSGISTVSTDVVNMRVAVKVESSKQKRQLLSMEVAVLRRLQGKPHFCQLLGCGKNTRFNYMVMTLQGQNLAEIRRVVPSAAFSQATAIRLISQCLDAVRTLHDAGFLHRDIKPSNFALQHISQNDRFSKPKIILLDFGLARPYTVAGPNSEVRSARSAAGFRGTVRYASIHAHQHRDLARRDDLWSLFYMFVEFISGQLPWRRVRDKQLVGQMKLAVDNEELALKGGVPPDVVKIWCAHLAMLDYESKPDYDLLENSLSTWLAKNHIGWNDAYDWERCKADSSILFDPLINKSRTDFEGKFQQLRCLDRLKPVDSTVGLRNPTMKHPVTHGKRSAFRQSVQSRVNDPYFRKSNSVNRLHRHPSKRSKSKSQRKSNAAIAEELTIQAQDHSLGCEVNTRYKTACFVDLSVEKTQTDIYCPDRMDQEEDNCGLGCELASQKSQPNLMRSSHFTKGNMNESAQIANSCSCSSPISSAQGGYWAARLPKPEAEPQVDKAPKLTSKEIGILTNTKEAPQVIKLHPRAATGIGFPEQQRSCESPCEETAKNDLKGELLFNDRLVDNLNPIMGSHEGLEVMNKNPRVKIQEIIRNLLARRKEEQVERHGHVEDEIVDVAPDTINAIIPISSSVNSCNFSVENEPSNKCEVGPQNFSTLCSQTSVQLHAPPSEDGVRHRKLTMCMRQLEHATTSKTIKHKSTAVGNNGPHPVSTVPPRAELSRCAAEISSGDGVLCDVFSGDGLAQRNKQTIPGQLLDDHAGRSSTDTDQSVKPKPLPRKRKSVATQLTEETLHGLLQRRRSTTTIFGLNKQVDHSVLTKTPLFEPGAVESRHGLIWNERETQLLGRPASEYPVSLAICNQPMKPSSCTRKVPAHVDWPLAKTGSAKVALHGHDHPRPRTQCTALTPMHGTPSVIQTDGERWSKRSQNGSDDLCPYLSVDSGIYLDTGNDCQKQKNNDRRPIC
ncbi:unnamed protein product [Dicrocoelium dendriticum]|nr:unnamed protein product [Dicrocoelium dendriticum]